jgi:hypothetical protein
LGQADQAADPTASFATRAAVSSFCPPKPQKTKHPTVPQPFPNRSIVEKTFACYLAQQIQVQGVTADAE